MLRAAPVRLIANHCIHIYFYGECKKSELSNCIWVKANCLVNYHLTLNHERRDTLPPYHLGIRCETVNIRTGIVGTAWRSNYCHWCIYPVMFVVGSLIQGYPSNCQPPHKRLKDKKCLENWKGRLFTKLNPLSKKHEVWRGLKVVLLQTYSDSVTETAYTHHRCTFN